MLSVSRAAAEEAQETLARLEHKMRVWREGFVVEHAREALPSDVASRPRIATLASDMAAARRIVEMVPLHTQVQHHSLSAASESAPLFARSAERARSGSFNVLDLCGRYGASGERGGTGRLPFGASLGQLAMKQTLSGEQAVAAVALLSEGAASVMQQLCREGQDVTRWQTAAEFGDLEPSALSLSLEELVAARLAERTSGARFRATLSREAADAVASWGKKRAIEHEWEAMELEDEEDAMMEGATNEAESDEEDEAEETYGPIAAGGGALRGGVANGTLLAAKERNESGKRLLFDPEAPGFAAPVASEAGDEENELRGKEPRPAKRPNPDKPDVNFRRMKLSGQKKNFRRAGTGKWGNVNHNFARPTSGNGGAGAASDLPVVEEEEAGLMPTSSVLYDPGAAVRERSALKEFEEAREAPPSRREWHDDASVNVNELLRELGHTEWKAGQEEVCQSIVEGKSVLALLPTGGGKSLCYLLPTLAYPGTLTLVVSPLVSLMRDQMARLPPSLGGAMLTSHQTAKELQQELARVADGSARILFVAPERVVQPSFARVLKLLPPVRLVCVDECHCLSQWSHCFRTSYLLLKDYLLDPLQPRCVLALTATAVPKAREQVNEALGIEHTVATSLLRPNLTLQSVFDPNDSHAALKKILNSSPVREMWGSGGGRVIVYVSLQRDAEQLAAYLTMESVPATAYHAGMDSHIRRATEESFRSGKVQIVVATVAFAMGIDVSNVRAIIHFDMPKSVENYVQEVGRAGRDGLPAACICIVSRLQLLRLTSLAYSQSVEAKEVRDYLALLRAQGAGVGSVPIDGAVARDVAATLLAWLHQDGLLKCLPDGHARFLVRWFQQGHHGSPVLQWALQNGAKKKKDSEWTAVKCCQCAKDLKMEMSEVHAEFERLSKLKIVGYRLEERSFFVDISTVLADWSDADLTAYALAMHARLTQMEDLNVVKCHDLYNILSLGDDAAIKAELHQYFQTGRITSAVPDLASRAFVNAEKDRYARGDVVTLLKTLSLTTGKEVARVMHGIRRNKEGDDPLMSCGYWNKGRHIEYRSLVRLANTLVIASMAAEKRDNE